jgi:hypothetical protein
MLRGQADEFIGDDRHRRFLFRKRQTGQRRKNDGREKK